MQKYNILKVKHRYHINRYCKLHNMQKRIIGRWKRDFDKVQLTNCKYKSLIGIYSWTHWATRWKHAQFRRVGSSPSNRTWVDSSSFLMTRPSNLATVQFVPGPGPKLTVWNRC